MNKQVRDKEKGNKELPGPSLVKPKPAYAKDGPTYRVTRLNRMLDLGWAMAGPSFPLCRRGDQTTLECSSSSPFLLLRIHCMYLETPR